MPITKTITLFTFDELADMAKEKARDWYRDASAYDSDAQETTLEDAKQIGLEITELHQHRANRGAFTAGAIDCAQAIVREHGKDCDTYKTAASFLQSMDSLNIEHPEDADGDRNSDYDNEKEELEANS